MVVKWEEETNISLGACYVAIGVVYLLMYTPCLVVLWQKNQRQHSCFKVNSRSLLHCESRFFLSILNIFQFDRTVQPSVSKIADIILIKFFNSSNYGIFLIRAPSNKKW